MTFPLNQILYGPPGTGKTYTTSEIAVKITDNAWYQQALLQYQGDALREQVTARYQMLVEKKRIMFTTFHQSFSYEDFIEGIRASTDKKTGQLHYDVEDGIFKQLCEQARENTHVSALPSVSLEGRRLWKMSLGNTQKREKEIYKECLANDYVLLGSGEDIDFSNCATKEAVKARIASKNIKRSVNEPVNLFRNEMRIGDLIIVSEGNLKLRAIAEITGKYHYLSNEKRNNYHQMRPVKWLKVYTPVLSYDRLLNKKFSQKSLYEFKDNTLDREKLAVLLAHKDDTVQQPLPHVLIIDEINRGNIARIFGELITLLEADKRKDADDPRSLILPYSKKSFSVPQQVYVIGTMNTADKSLIQMDLALRRRFSFIEMPAQPELLAGVTAFDVDVAQLLTRINQRIEALLDSEYTIGHAYFMPLKRIENRAERETCLASIFQHKIIPLLREYFFDDYERIGWVLNDPVKDKPHRFILLQTATQLPPLTQLFPKDIAENLADRRFRLNEAAFMSAEAYQGILA